MLILQFCCTKTKDKYLFILRKTSKNGKYEQISTTPWGEVKDALTPNNYDNQFDAGEINWSSVEFPDNSRFHWHIPKYVRKGMKDEDYERYILDGMKKKIEYNEVIEAYSAKKLENFLRVSTKEIKEFVRLTGNDSVHKMDIKDLCTTNSEISKYTEISHV